MNDLSTKLRLDLRSGLAAIYGPRLKGLFLFGSYARGQAQSESDLDVLVVLDRIDHYGAEIDRTGHLASRLSLEHGVTISRVFVSQADWKERRTAFLVNARAEAVAA
ncbi:nucleotidyltransferase domain-containing protein [Candidatus Thiodictyon syntrophicum]|jgi:predicted nucleotidyltransferase|uniref:Polymerase nucleotidyl transferase domain-containing protein n=1 Tax=Candidatus Thiodictyon syntrophicum TaxID=1166950 RepID=A0A2K8UFD4_9GAMM|nr:nucleotidyltransferase domain-containing protein [Candidatus Thiodictyon syntrophicum]AUB84179.1 hypothetical protein THSYN_26715 [Candidatus Thiodictyon syntrophicum]